MVPLSQADQKLLNQLSHSSRVNIEATFLKKIFCKCFHKFWNEDLLKQMAVAHSRFTLEGGFNCFIQPLIVLHSGTINFGVRCPSDGENWYQITENAVF